MLALHLPVQVLNAPLFEWVFLSIRLPLSLIRMLNHHLAWRTWKITVIQVLHWVDISVPSVEPNTVNSLWNAKSVALHWSLHPTWLALTITCFLWMLFKKFHWKNIKENAIVKAAKGRLKINMFTFVKSARMYFVWIATYLFMILCTAVLAAFTSILLLHVYNTRCL